MSDADWWDFHESVMGHRRTSSTAGVPDEFLRIGVEYPDGRKATNVAQASNADPRLRFRRPPEPSLFEHGAGGTGRSESFASGRSVWLWPLPPAEPFDLVIEWPAHGVAVTRLTLEGSEITAASLRAEPAW